jgi:hypothetical protein
MKRFVKRFWILTGEPNVFLDRVDDLAFSADAIHVAKSIKASSPELEVVVLDTVNHLTIVVRS